MQLREVIQNGTQKSIATCSSAQDPQGPHSSLCWKWPENFAELIHPGCLMCNLPKDHILKSHLPKKKKKKEKHILSSSKLT